MAPRFPKAVRGGGFFGREHEAARRGLSHGAMGQANAEEVTRCAEVFEGHAVGGNFGVKTSRFSWGAVRAWRGCVEGVRCPFIIGRAWRAAWPVVPGRKGPWVASR